MRGSRPYSHVNQIPNAIALGINGLGLPRPAQAAGRLWGLVTGTAIASAD